jgi:hypothetical protein
VLNRGNGRMRLFRKLAEYDAFLRILVQGWRGSPASSCSRSV